MVAVKDAGVARLHHFEFGIDGLVVCLDTRVGSFRILLATLDLFLGILEKEVDVLLCLLLDQVLLGQHDWGRLLWFTLHYRVALILYFLALVSVDLQAAA